MQIYAPDYYKDFSCIAGLCRHTCCKGWEIDIDGDTYEKYKKADGTFGEKLRRNMYTDAEGAHFTLDAEERCPFLNAENLCEIILEKGENALCQICTDHPRYRNFFESRTEIGLGLSCESACALILGRTKKPEFICLTEENGMEVPEEEALFFRFRAELLELIFSEIPIEECIRQMQIQYGIRLPKLHACTNLYNGLTVLYWDWQEKIKNLHRKGCTMERDMPAKQLMAYFICRHLADSFFDGRWETGLAFCLHATQMVMHLADEEKDFAETARQYSEEIEYDSENLEAIFDFLEKGQTGFDNIFR